MADLADGNTRGEQMYTTEGLGAELRQSEIISGLVQDIYDPIRQGTFFEPMPYAIVLAQDCDLLRDYESRNSKGPSIMNGILLYEMETKSDIRKEDRVGGRINSDLWRRIEKNDDSRYHYLPSAPPENDLVQTGLPELVVDFRRYFAMSASEIERQLGLEN